MADDPVRGSKTEMDVLVDYNNLRDHHRRRGVVFVIDKILAAIGERRLCADPRVSFRLYEGWYSSDRLTRRAQEISTEVQSVTPMTRTFMDGEKAKTIVVKIELAYSLLSEPAQHLLNTCRTNSHPEGLGMDHPSSAGCTDPTCPLIAAYKFFTHYRCPAESCKITPVALFHRTEQKLVDTMIAADLFSLQLQACRQIALVTSDDDLWPAIKLLLRLGVEVLHVQTIDGRRTPPMYSRNAGPAYTELQL